MPAGGSRSSHCPAALRSSPPLEGHGVPGQGTDSRDTPEKPFGPAAQGGGSVCLPSLLPPRAPVRIPAQRLSGTGVLSWSWPGPDTWRPTHDHRLGHGE